MNFENINPISNQEGLDTEKIQAAKENLIECLSDGNINRAKEIKETFLNTQEEEEVLKSQEVTEAAEQGLIECLSDGYINDAKEIKEIFLNTQEEFLKSQEVTEAAELGLIECLSYGDINK